VFTNTRTHTHTYISNEKEDEEEKQKSIRNCSYLTYCTKLLYTVATSPPAPSSPHKKTTSMASTSSCCGVNCGPCKPEECEKRRFTYIDSHEAVIPCLNSRMAAQANMWWTGCLPTNAHALDNCRPRTGCDPRTGCHRFIECVSRPYVDSPNASQTDGVCEACGPFMTSKRCCRPPPPWV